eukprot:Colp12_sorted_trinity150504_noHs@7787
MSDNWEELGGEAKQGLGTKICFAVNAALITAVTGYFFHGIRGFEFVEDNYPFFGGVSIFSVIALTYAYIQVAQREAGKVVNAKRGAIQDEVQAKHKNDKLEAQEKQAVIQKEVRKVIGSVANSESVSYALCSNNFLYVAIVIVMSYLMRAYGLPANYVTSSVTGATVTALLAAGTKKE